MWERVTLCGFRQWSYKPIMIGCKIKPPGEFRIFQPSQRTVLFGVAVTKLTCDTPSGILMPVRLKPGNHLTTGNGTTRYLFELFNLMPAPPANRIKFAVDLLLDSRNLHCGRLTIALGWGCARRWMIRGAMGGRAC